MINMCLIQCALSLAEISGDLRAISINTSQSRNKRQICERLNSLTFTSLHVTTEYPMKSHTLSNSSSRNVPVSFHNKHRAFFANIFLIRMIYPAPQNNVSLLTFSECRKHHAPRRMTAKLLSVRYKQEDIVDATITSVHV